MPYFGGWGFGVPFGVGEAGRPGKLVKRTAAEVSARQIEIARTVDAGCGEDLLVCLY